MWECNNVFVWASACISLCVCVCVCVLVWIMQGCWSHWMIDDSEVMDKAHAGSHRGKNKNQPGQHHTTSMYPSCAYSQLSVSETQSRFFIYLCTVVCFVFIMWQDISQKALRRLNRTSYTLRCKNNLTKVVALHEKNIGQIEFTLTPSRKKDFHKSCWPASNFNMSFSLSCISFN